MLPSLAYPSPSYSPFWNRLPILFLLVALPVGVMGALLAPQDLAPLMLIAPMAAFAGVVLVVHPELLLILTVIIFPIENSQILNPFLPPSITIPKTLGALLLGAWLFNIIFRRQRFRIFDDAQDYAVVIFCAILLFSSTTTILPAQVFGEIDRILRLIAFYFALKNLVNGPRTMYFIMVGMFLTSIYAAGYGIYEANSTTSVWGLAIRASGINEDPNFFALQSLIAITIGVFLFRATRPNVVKLFYVLGIGTLILGIFFSGSRGGMLTLAVLGGIMILQHPKGIQILTALVLLTLLSVPVWPEHIRSRFISSDADFANSFEQSADRTADRRASYVEYGFEIVVEKPVLGTGYRTFSRLYPLSEFARFDNPLSELETYRVAHNIYLETAVGAGLLGLLALLAMLMTALRACYLAAKKLDPGSIPWATAKAVQYGLIAFVVASIFLSTDQYKYLWFLLGMSSVLLHYARTEIDHLELETM